MQTSIKDKDQELNGKSEGDVELVNYLSIKYKELKNEISKVIIGHDDIIDNIITAIISSGHCLLIGVPGLAKTLLVKTLAEVLELKFNRIQFTPDLMPADIIGTEIIEEDLSTGSKTFRFIKGPLFANMILADEINRTPPKTQSALLEAMQEHMVTAAGVTYTLEEPFFVIATQNPIENEGTYPLPEAQLDRFMFNIWLNYPSFHEETDIIKYTTSMYKPELKVILKKEEIIKLQNLVRRVPVSNNVIEYAVRLVSKTRTNSADAPKYIKDWLSWGAGPRASQYLILAAKASCILDGRYTPQIDDVKKAATPVLRHRLITNFNAESDGIKTTDIITKLLNE